MKRLSRLAAILAIAASSLGSSLVATVRLSDFSRGLAGWSVHRIDRSVPLTRFRAERVDGRDAAVRRFQNRIPVGRHVAVALIVAKDYYNIGTACLFCSICGKIRL